MSPNLFIRNSWRLNLLFLIKLLYTHLSNSDKSDILNSMKSICDMSAINSAFSTLPSACECSSVAVYATNMLYSAYALGRLRNNLNFVYIENGYSFDDLTNGMKAENLDKFVADMNTKIDNYNINAMIFDNLDSDALIQSCEYTIQNWTSLVVNFFNAVKTKYPEVIFGLALIDNQTNVQNVFVTEDISRSVDVFLIKTYNNNTCADPSSNTTSKTSIQRDHFQNTIKSMQCLKLPPEKTLVIIEFIVQTAGSNTSSMSYLDYCGATNLTNQNSCFDTLQNLYQKGQQVCRNCLLGYLLKSIINDDRNNSCQCGNFPVARAVSAGANCMNLSEDLECCIQLS